MAEGHALLVSKRSLCEDFLGKPHLLINENLRTIDWSKQFALLENYEPVRRLSHQILHTVSKRKLFSVDNLLDKEQCQQIINVCQQQQRQEMKRHYKTGRNNLRLVIFEKDFASYVWGMLRSVIDEVFSEHTVFPLGFDVLQGDWRFAGINKTMRFNEYRSEYSEFFHVHRDSQFCPSGDERSLLSLVIYLSDDFTGGETKFYFPKQNIDIKGMCMAEELERNGGLDTGYEAISVTPKSGSAILFNQDILHESLPIGKESSEHKFILKTDVMLVRETQRGFSVSDSEKDDFLKSLDLFRQAQNIELTEDGDAGVFYERCLSIRYSYPTKEMITKVAELHCRTTTLKDEETLPEVQCSQHSDNSEFVPDNHFMSLPVNIIFYLFKYVDEQGLVNLTITYPHLLEFKKKLDGEKFIPEVICNKGIYSAFLFNNKDFALANLEGCCRIAAIYAVYLLGHTSDSTSYVVNYDATTDEVMSVDKTNLFSSVFYEERAYATVFKAHRKEGEGNDPRKDLFYSVDRSFMLHKFGNPFFGTSISSGTHCHIVKHGVEEEDANDVCDENESHANSKAEDVTKSGPDDEDGSESDLDEEENSENDVDSDNDFCYDGSSMKGQIFYDELRDLCVDNIGDPAFVNAWDRFFDSTQTNQESSLFELVEPGNNVSKDEFDDLDERTLLYLKFAMSLLDKGNCSNILRDNSHVGAMLLRKLNKKLVCGRGLGMCCCYWPPDPFVDLNAAMDSITANHLIMDFQKQTLSVSKFDPFSEEKCCCVQELLIRKVCEGGDRYTDVDKNVFFYTVQIESLLESNHTGFNHAACNCSAPGFDLLSYVNVRSYPYLNHIHLAVIQEGSSLEMWVCYGGIAAL